jgi:hypothetical protein
VEANDEEHEAEQNKPSNDASGSGLGGERALGQGFFKPYSNFELVLRWQGPFHHLPCEPRVSFLSLLSE